MTPRNKPSKGSRKLAADGRPPVAREPRIEREQAESAFAGILNDLLRRIPGSRAAALIDVEGETVDYAGSVEPFALRLAAAHWRIVLAEASDAAARRCGTPRWIAVRAARGTAVVHVLPDGYAILVLLSTAAAFWGWRRAMDACLRAVSEEAGWRTGTGAGAPRAWHPIEVLCDARGRPKAIVVRDRAMGLDVLGALPRDPAGRGERGWRIRLESGIEANVVREVGGSWYADERVSERAASSSRANRPSRPPRPPFDSRPKSR